MSIFLQNIDAEQMIDMEREDRETGRERQAKKKKKRERARQVIILGRVRRITSRHVNFGTTLEKKNSASAWRGK